MQGRGRIGAFGKRQIDQCGFAAHGGPILELPGQIGTRRGDAILPFHQLGQRQDRRDAAVMLAHFRQECARARQVADLLVVGKQTGQHFRQIVRIMARSALVGPDCGLVVAGIRFQPSFEDPGAHATGIGLVGARDGRAGGADVVGGAVTFGQFAFELRDQLAHRLAGHFFVTQGIVDRFLPVPLGLVDPDQVLQCLRRTLIDTG